MKLLTPSYSSPSSSSSTFSFDSTFCTSKSVIAGCFSFTTIFQRIKKLHSKFIFSSEKVQILKTKKTTKSTIISSSMEKNGIEIDSESNPFSVSVSHNRTLNSVHSVCSVPEAFHLVKNENFLVLSFESGSESKRFRSKKRRKEKGCVDLRQRSEEKRNKRENVNDMCSVFDDCEKVKKRKKGRTCFLENKVESECGLEDSSPVSVFDFEFDDNGTELDYYGVGMSWKRKLSPMIENDQLIHLMNEEESKAKEIENNMQELSKKKERQKQNQECVDIWCKICKIVDDELIGTIQLEEVKSKKSDFESISADFELEILDELLDELIDQFVTFCL